MKLAAYRCTSKYWQCVTSQDDGCSRHGTVLNCLSFFDEAINEARENGPSEYRVCTDV